MKNLSTACLLLCAVTIYAQLDFQKFVVKSCAEITKEFTNNEKCKDYQLPDYLLKARDEFQKIPANNQPKWLDMFNMMCCVMESLGVINTDAKIDMSKLADHLVERLDGDNDLKDKICSCADEETKYTSEEDKTIDRMYPVIMKCAMCNCLKQDYKTLLKNTLKDCA